VQVSFRLALTQEVEESPGRVWNLSSEEAQMLPFVHYDGLCHVQTLGLHCKGKKKFETYAVLQQQEKKACHFCVLQFIWVLRSLKFLLNPGSKKEQKTLPFCSEETEYWGWRCERKASRAGSSASTGESSEELWSVVRKWLLCLIPAFTIYALVF